MVQCASPAGMGRKDRGCIHVYVVHCYCQFFDWLVLIIKPPLATARAASRINAVHLFVYLSVAKIHKNAIFSKTKQFRAMLFLDDL